MKGDEQLEFSDPILTALDEGMRTRCAAKKANNQRCRNRAPAWYVPGLVPWFCQTHRKENRCA